jgi:hypothetical protein
VIVVVGLPRLGRAEPPRATGLAATIAKQAAGAGAAVQLMGKLGDDPEGDLVLIDLAAAGVAHPAVLRDPVRRTPSGSAHGAGDRAPAPTLELADLELGLRYVPDFRVLVLAAPELPSLIAGAADAASFAGAQLIVIAKTKTPVDNLPAGVTVVSAPRGEPDGESALTALVAAYAVALDAGEESREAWRKASVAAGAEVSDRA